jgi:hypothetical protein
MIHMNIRRAGLFPFGSDGDTGIGGGRPDGIVNTEAFS